MEVFPDLQIGDFIFDLDILFIPLISVILCWIIFKVVTSFVASQLFKYGENNVAYAVAEQISTIKLWTPVVTGIYISLYLLPDIKQPVMSAAQAAFLVVWILEIIDVVFGVINYLVIKSIEKSGDVSNEQALKLLGKITKVVVWIIAFLLVISNLGFDINSLIAGLGVGGIAVALAVQTVLSDLISSVSIVTDKPFQAGDFVIVGKYQGFVKKVGVRSTRVRSIDGEEIIIPNSELVKSSIQNFGSLKQRRSFHHIGVTYETDPLLLKDVPLFISDILHEHEKIKDENYRVHMVKFNDYSIDFEVVFFVETKDYNEFLQVQQEVLYAIKDKFETEGIAFAYPTQTIHTVKS